MKTKFIPLLFAAIAICYAINSNAQNTQLGQDALHDITTGTDNTAIGFQSMYRTNTGSSNTAVGSLSLWANTIGYNNTATGIDQCMQTQAAIITRHMDMVHSPGTQPEK
jgi:hypothetical protein